MILRYGIQMMLTIFSLSLLMLDSIHADMVLNADISSITVCSCNEPSKELLMAVALYGNQAEINLDTVQKLLPLEGEFSNASGTWVSDGNTAVVGDSGYNCEGCDSDIGSVYIFIKMNNKWILQQKITAPDEKKGDRFGSSVSLDGDTVVIGAIDIDISIDHTLNYIFVRSGTKWTLQQKLITFK